MKVRELMAMLEGEDQEADVKVAYDYGDHWHTKVSPDISYVESGPVVHSEYHRMDRVVEDERGLDGERQAVILFT